MEDSGTPRKRLVLSAARADQHSVRIDLYRSTDGLMEDAALIGSLDLESDESLEFQDIAFEVSVDEEAQLSATATLPNGQSSSVDLDLSEFRADSRTDSDILGDSTFDDAELDTLDDAFGADTLDDIPEDGDTLSMDLPESPDDLPDLPDDEEPLDKSFEIDDLDAGFGMDEVPDLDEAELDAEPLDEPAAKPAAKGDDEDESWHDFSMDDMEPMEFLDTGDVISAPKAKAKAAASEFSMDDEAPLDLSDDTPLGDDFGDLDDLSDSLPSFGEEAGPSPMDDAGFDEDFLPPPELSDEAYVPPSKARPEKAPKTKEKPETKAKAPKPAKPVPRREGVGAIDKTALVLSMITLSLLVASLIVLLLLNVMRPPQVPAIQPEVQAWPTGPQTAQQTQSLPAVSSVDLGRTPWPEFQATNVQEVPAGLLAVPVTLQLAGTNLADATRRFGAPDRVEGDLLSW